MCRQLHVLVPLLGIGMTGLLTNWPPAGVGIEEVSAAVTNELIGGTTCQDWRTLYCPKLSDATSACPFTGGYAAPPSGPAPFKDRYGSGVEWCGCTQQCNGAFVTKSIPKCGSSDDG